MDNQRLIIWGLFAVMAYLTWQTWMEDNSSNQVPPAPVSEEAVLPADDLGELPELAAEDEELPTVGEVPATTSEKPAVQAGSVIVVTTDVFEIEINTRGGTLQKATMSNYPVAKDRPDEKIKLLNADVNDLGAIRSWLRSKTGAAPDANTVYETTTQRFELNGDDELVVPLTWTDDGGVTVTKRYIFRRGSYEIQLQQEVRNNSDAPWRGDQVTQLQRRSYDLERSMFNVDSYSFDGALIFNGDKAEKLKRKDLLNDGATSFTSDNGWYASIQHHFLSAIVPPADSTNIFQVRVGGNRLTASVISAPQTVAPGETTSFDKTLFVGPKLQVQLDEIHPKLALSVDYGWLVILSQPMFWLLAWIYKFVGNWGWSIIGVTILIKLAFYKLTEASGRSMAKMREIQPRMKALQDRYKDDRQALSQAMMEL